jgi:hypothetical protein
MNLNPAKYTVMQYARTLKANTQTQRGKTVASRSVTPNGRILPSRPKATDGFR